MKTANALGTQTAFWNGWNATHREAGLDGQEVSRRQAQIVTRWLSETGRTDLEILDVGCGGCWLAPLAQQFGKYTGTDISDEVLSRAAMRYPDATFVAGDFAALDLGREKYDVVVTLEVLSHVADQRGFIEKIISHLKPGGLLMLATQNRPALERNAIPPPADGQLRRWVDRRELHALLTEQFAVTDLFSVTPRFNRGLLRLANSPKAHKILQNTIPALSRGIVNWQERNDLGWTLMARARKRN